MATGAVGGAYQKYGEQYRDHLAKFGVTLELKQTNGAAENFALLRDGRATSPSCRAVSAARWRT